MSSQSLESTPSANESHDISAFDRRLITATVSIGSIATILTATIMNVAIPDVMGAFGIGQDKAQWVSTGFLAATTCAMLMADWSVRRIGPKNTFIAAMLFFIAGSLVSGGADTFEQLVLGRVMQGAAGGITQPLAMMTMFQIYPPHERGKAMGIFGLVIILAPAIGPWVGGITIDTLGWRAIFILPIPVSFISVLLATVFLKPRDPNMSAPIFDWPGFGLLTLFVITLLVALTNGSAEDWASNYILLLLAASIAGFLGFIFWELGTAQPLLNIRLFAEPRFFAANVVSFIYGAAIFGSIYLVPLFVQLIQGYTPTRSGVLQFPAGVAMAIVFPLVGKLTDFGNEHRLVALGLVIAALSSYLMVGAHTDTTFWEFATWMVISRIGLAMIFPPLSAASLSVLPPSLVGQGSGTMNFTRSLGGAFGVNLAAIYVENRSAAFRANLTSTQHDGRSTTMELIDQLQVFWSNFGIPEHFQEPMSHLFLGNAIIRQAQMLAFRDGFLLLAIVTLLAIIPSLMIRKKS